ncbi:MAG: DNA polymerase III subunit delta [marine bacterium B5-7]|nr:MAG: DNA polymerase III subunit delta [marine bacterium B5-7]
MTLRPITLITGDEPLLVEEACHSVRENAKQAGFTERVRLIVEAGFKWTQLLDATNNLSLFAEKQLIELHLPTAKVPKDASEIIRQIAERPSPDTIILLRAPKFDRNAQKSAWWQAIQRVGIIQQIWPLDADKLPQWLTQRAQTLGITLRGEALSLLAGFTEGNLLAAKQALDKLALLHPNDNITTEHIQEAIADQAQFDVFGLADTVLRAQTDKLERMLLQLKQSGVATTLILWALLKDLNVLIQLQQTNNTSALFQKNRVWPKRQAYFQKAMRRYDEAGWSTLLHTAAQVDANIKGMGDGDPWSGLLDLAYRMAGISEVAHA